MSTNEAVKNSSAVDNRATADDMKLEVVIIPVADVDRSKAFYTKLGWRLDADFPFDNGFRIVQFTPPGSSCSVQFGQKLTSAAPGSVRDFYLIVSNIEAVREAISSRGVAISDVFHPGVPGAQFHPEDVSNRLKGAARNRSSYSSFAAFSDPDGNRWLLQEVTTRLPGRVASDTTYTSAADLSEALQRAAKAHGEHEKRIGQADPKWPDWYAEYMVREQSGEELPR